MFDQILQMVKDHLGNNPEVTSTLSPEKQDEVHNEVANQITQGLATQASQQGGIGGLLQSLQNAATNGSPVTAIEGGLISSLANRFGLPPSVTGAIAGALPGLLQKFAHKANDPNDDSITPDAISKSISNMGTGSIPGANTTGLSNLMNQN
ncbi:MAG TPA: DUF937 domain-containing protein [Flavisolibacter sp.]|nr:DUF937 domain-containing protein [Flavisolibacter sp.]